MAGVVALLALLNGVWLAAASGAVAMTSVGAVLLKSRSGSVDDD